MRNNIFKVHIQNETIVYKIIDKNINKVFNILNNIDISLLFITLFDLKLKNKIIQESNILKNIECKTYVLPKINIFLND